MAAFREFGIRTVLAVSAAVAPKLLAAGLDCYLLGFPPGMDVNQYALQAADPSQALGAIIRKAQWLGKGQPAVPVTAAVEAPSRPAMPTKRCRPNRKPTTKRTKKKDELDDDDWDEMEDEADDLDDDGPDQSADASPPACRPRPPRSSPLHPCRHRRKRSKPT